MTSPRSLYLFTTSQNPLPGRYPRPAKPVLNVPPLIHRSLHQALDQSPPSLSISQNQTITIPHIEHVRKYDIPSASEHDELEITLKIHLIGPAKSEERATWVKEALGLVQSAIGIGGADTLLIGFKGVDYKGKKTVDANGSDSGDNIPASDYSVSSDMEDHIIEFWTHLVDWLSKEDGVTIKTLGTMYLPLGVLKRLKGLKTDQEELGRIKVNSLDTPDCHHLPKEYTSWAKENGVQLWAGGGGEGSDPLPSAELHNILQEFSAHLPSQSTSSLSKLIPLDAEGKWDQQASPAVSVKWVMGYTVVSSSRNVVEDKGYVVAADMIV